jgi:hypothetical protein
MDDQSRVVDLMRQLARALEDNAILYDERELVIEENEVLREENAELKQRVGRQEPLLHD